MKNVTIKTVGDSALLIQFKQQILPEVNEKVTGLLQQIREEKMEGIVDMIPAFCSLLIQYDSRIIRYETLKEKIERLISTKREVKKGKRKIIEIPVCYGGVFGPDIETVGRHAGITQEEVVKRHTSRDYLIYMLGFLPGFCYLGGLDERLATPRLANPRIKIPAGSVGIGGLQTGIYPVASPGGWQLIGRTPVKTYDTGREHPILFEAGDYIRFVPVSQKAYAAIQKEVDRNEYQCKTYYVAEHTKKKQDRG